MGYRIFLQLPDAERWRGPIIDNPGGQPPEPGLQVQSGFGMGLGDRAFFLHGIGRRDQVA